MKYKYQLIIILVFITAGLILASCQSSSAPEITILSPWGRPSPKVATAGAFYMVIKNSGGQADKLLSASSDSCGVLELHETYDKGDGVMGMRELENGYIEIPAFGEAKLKMGGMHLMCIEKLDDFEKGATLTVTLEFEVTGVKSIEVEIRNPDM